MIITADFDETAHGYFTDLRRKHFPPERNYLDAHLTLFHAVPDGELARITDDLKTLGRRAPVELQVTGLKLLGNGVAFTLLSTELWDLRTEIAEQYWDKLTKQDQVKFDLHITVQNKVDPQIAKGLCADLQRNFEPMKMRATGLHVWRYDNGPWTSLATVPFSGSTSIDLS